MDDQTIEAAESAPPTAQLNSIAGNAPDVIVAFPLGAQCPVFLNELANQKAANPGWEPRVYLTNTCASPLILGAAGETANGLYTSGAFGAVDITNPDNQTIPGVAGVPGRHGGRGPDRHRADERGGLDLRRGDRRDPAPGRGVTRGPDPGVDHQRGPQLRLPGRPSIREGIPFKTNGEEDGYLVESAQIVQYDAATTFLNDVGELITSVREQLNAAEREPASIEAGSPARCERRTPARR